MAAIHERLKTMRERTGLTKGQVAEYLGVERSFVSEVEAGEKDFTADQLERVADFYGYSLAAVFADTEGDVLSPHFVFGVQNVSPEDLRIIADIRRIANNSRFMADALEGTNVR